MKLKPCLSTLYNIHPGIGSGLFYSLCSQNGVLELHYSNINKFTSTSLLLLFDKISITQLEKLKKGSRADN